jgi:hypothetical protein
VEPNLEPLSPSKERPTLSPPATGNRSSPKASVAETYSSEASVCSEQGCRKLESYKTSARRQSVIEGKRVKPQSRGGTPQTDNISPPGSRRASRRLSALFQLRGRNAVPLLNQKLMEHQEDLKRMRNDAIKRLNPLLKQESMKSRILGMDKSQMP